jgi:hypothetical protein
MLPAQVDDDFRNQLEQVLADMGMEIRTTTVDIVTYHNRMAAAWFEEGEAAASLEEFFSLNPVDSWGEFAGEPYLMHVFEHYMTAMQISKDVGATLSTPYIGNLNDMYVSGLQFIAEGVMGLFTGNLDNVYNSFVKASALFESYKNQLGILYEYEGVHFSR